MRSIAAEANMSAANVKRSGRSQKEKLALLKQLLFLVRFCLPAIGSVASG
jgi:hypothetical protein